MGTESVVGGLSRFYGWLLRHRSLLGALILAKRLRTTVAFVGCTFCAGVVLVQGARATSAAQTVLSMVTGGMLIGSGLLLRVGGLGVLRKKEMLATTGVYSLCRHPLYLGSMLITFGYCCLLQDRTCWVVATAYFAVFYTVTVAWEEVRLRGLYGSEHERYAHGVPLLLPLGEWVSGSFSWSLARRHGAVRLLLVVVVLASIAAWLRVAHAAPLKTVAESAWAGSWW